MEGFFDVGLYLILGAAFPLIAVGFAALLRPSNPDPDKLSIYECGVDPYGDARVRFHIRYYIFALMFVIFDVETVFMYPWAALFKDLGAFALVEMLIFIGLLVLALIYAWKERVLRWI